MRVGTTEEPPPSELGINECEKNSGQGNCQHGAGCENSDGGFRCVCEPGFTGIFCEESKWEHSGTLLNIGHLPPRYNCAAIPLSRDFEFQHFPSLSFSLSMLFLLFKMLILNLRVQINLSQSKEIDCLFEILQFRLKLAIKVY